MKTVTMKTKAWATEYTSSGPKDWTEGKRLDDLMIYGFDRGSAGLTFVGEAELTVHLVDEKTLINNKVESLREQAKSIRAEATAKCTQIESQIQNLLAITYDEQVGS